MRVSLALTATLWGLGCGAGATQTAVPDQDVGPDSKVIVEESTLMLVDGSEMVAMAVRFPVDSAELDDKDKRVLNLLAEFLRANEHLSRIEVRGHSDERGTELYNTQLSRRRARIVARYLTSQGVEAERLKVEWFGDDRPAVRGQGEAVWSQNRRVEFVVVDRQDT